ncbi:hypothetical protein N9X64_00445 [bacterium]|nr:hypothetical protein [bacterium]
MQIRSLRDAETLRATVVRVEAEITNRRQAITNNQVPNAGIARHHLEALVRANKHRKAILHMNRNEILAMQEANMQFTPLRTSFVQKRTPKSERVSINKRDSKRKRRARQPGPDGPSTPRKKSYAVIDGKYYFEGKQVSKAQYKKLMEPIRQRNITKKQRKKENKPIPDLVQPTPPMMVIQPATPPSQAVSRVADSIRQNNHITALEKSLAITRAKDAQRDAELVRNGQSKLVETRRKRAAAEKQAAINRAVVDNRNRRVNAISKRANTAVKVARQRASRSSQLSVGKSRSNAIRRANFRPMTRGSRGTGFVPQLAVMMSLTDRNRAANVSKSVRTRERPLPPSHIRDQITEDIRQHKPLPNPNRRSPEFMAFMEEITPMYKMAYKEINLAKQGEGNFGYLAKTLGPQRTQFYASKAFALLGEIKRLVSNEAIRWEQGTLSSGVAVSTDSRSQSTRKMTRQEFGAHIEKKVTPKMKAFFMELQEEVQRTMRERAARSKPAEEKIVLDNSLAVNRQRSLAASDKIRGRGRPVLSEQRGTKGLAGLFPALRSSMQGVLK